MEKNLLLTIEYDGTNFFGWQRQPGLRTGQGEIEKALSLALGRVALIEGVSRTDKGVHARDQKVTFRGDIKIPTEKIPQVLNRYLAKWQGVNEVTGSISDIRVTKAEEMEEGFHARFSALGKTYSYRIFTGMEEALIWNRYCFINDELDLAKMREAGRLLVGTHDFGGFQSTGSNPRLTTVRTIYNLNLKAEGDSIIMEVTGDGFLYNMVRIIAGSLIDVGRGKIGIEHVEKALLEQRRELLGFTAPAQGLCLEKVYYNLEEIDKIKLREM